MDSMFSLHKKDMQQGNKAEKAAKGRSKSSRNKPKGEDADDHGALLILITNLAIVFALLILAKSCSKEPFLF